MTRLALAGFGGALGASGFDGRRRIDGVAGETDAAAERRQRDRPQAGLGPLEELAAGRQAGVLKVQFLIEIQSNVEAHGISPW